GGATAGGGRRGPPGLLGPLVGVDADARVHDGLVADRHLVADRDALVDARMRTDVAVAPDDRTLDDGAAPDVAGRVEHRARDASALAQRRAGSEHRVRADRGLGRHTCVVADERGPFDALHVVDLDALAD